MVKNTGEVVAYSAMAVPCSNDVSPKPIDQVLAEDNPKLQIDFLLKEWVPLVVINAQAGGFGVSTQKSPVISYRRGGMGAAGLGMSNLAAYMKYPSADLRSMQSKSPEFVKWSKRVFTYAKKIAPEKVLYNGYSYSASKRVKSELEKQAVKLTF